MLVSEKLLIFLSALIVALILAPLFLPSSLKNFLPIILLVILACLALFWFGIFAFWGISQLVKKIPPPQYTANQFLKRAKKAFFPFGCIAQPNSTTRISVDDLMNPIIQDKEYTVFKRLYLPSSPTVFIDYLVISEKGIIAIKTIKSSRDQATYTNGSRMDFQKYRCEKIQEILKNKLGFKTKVSSVLIYLNEIHFENSDNKFLGNAYMNQKSSYMLCRDSVSLLSETVRSYSKVLLSEKELEQIIKLFETF